MDSKTITREELAGLFDHTYLKAFATKDDLKKLCDEAEEMQTAMDEYLSTKSDSSAADDTAEEATDDAAADDAE